MIKEDKIQIALGLKFLCTKCMRVLFSYECYGKYYGEDICTKCGGEEIDRLLDGLTSE